VTLALWLALLSAPAPIAEPASVYQSAACHIDEIDDDKIIPDLRLPR